VHVVRVKDDDVDAAGILRSRRGLLREQRSARERDDRGRAGALRRLFEQVSFTAHRIATPRLGLSQLVGACLHRSHE